VGDWAWPRLPWRDMLGVLLDGTHGTYGFVSFGLMSPVGPVRLAAPSASIKETDNIFVINAGLSCSIFFPWSQHSNTPSLRCSTTPLPRPLPGPKFSLQVVGVLTSYRR
jgi:hypothetical protein